MEQKKETKEQILRKLKNAIIHIDKTKGTKSIFFDDKGVRLTVNEDYAIIETGYHRHVFSAYNVEGYSRPYLYTHRVIDIALENDCTVTDDKGNATGYSYTKLLKTLKEKEDNAEYNIVTVYDWYLLNIFQPLYKIGESEIQSFLVYFEYMHNIAVNAIILSEKTEDMTIKDFIKKYNENIKDFTENILDSVLFAKKSDEEVMQENIEAIQQQELDEQMKQQ